jgi:Glycosyltransferase family 9 (heptosyltransferase)
MCRLLIGDLYRGWEKNEWRWETEQIRHGKRSFPQPLWLGSDEIAGKSVLLHAEQGLGDTIQFCRYAPLVAARGARVILEVQAPLHDLLCTLSRAVQIVSAGDPLPDFDLHCPLLSLPLAFATRLETIPSATPYLSSQEGKTRAWRERLGQHEKPRIGVAWAGNPRKELPGANRIDGQRSIAFDRLAPLFQITTCEFFSLQKGDDAVRQLRDSILRQRVMDYTDDLHDFADTAALIENLDLVISVDTSVAHVAGALGKPFWLLNRYNTCWRWLLDREDSPWYPTARLFRQDATREWDSVVARIATALRDQVRSTCTTLGTADAGKSLSPDRQQDRRT